jgi:SAM-dependent methyltransferase
MITAQKEGIHEGERLLVENAITLLCWRCGASLSNISFAPRTGSGDCRCPRCAATTQYQDGIWLSLSPEQNDHFRRFVTEYEFIRAAEGRGSPESEYYLSLPYKDISGRNSDQWAIRTCTFRALVREIVSPLAKRLGRPLRILDVGAGNGWLSYRLALLGHLPVAVDLLTNDRDGLGAAIHFSSLVHPLFPRVQAALDRLPFASSTFDLVIFNASFHYSEDYQRTFAEALRCTRSGGAVVVADTPWYAREESGQGMVEEKHERFTAAYGFPSDSISSLEYLTPNRLQRLKDEFNLELTWIKPFYGFRWILRPFFAKIKGRRRPSEFRIYKARVNA